MRIPTHAHQVSLHPGRFAIFALDAASKISIWLNAKLARLHSPMRVTFDDVARAGWNGVVPRFLHITIDQQAKKVRQDIVDDQSDVAEPMW